MIQEFILSILFILLKFNGIAGYPDCPGRALYFIHDFAHQRHPAGQAGDVAFDGFHVLQVDVRVAAAAGGKAVADDAPD